MREIRENKSPGRGERALELTSEDTRSIDAQRGTRSVNHSVDKVDPGSGP